MPPNQRQPNKRQPRNYNAAHTEPPSHAASGTSASDSWGTQNWPIQHAMLPCGAPLYDQSCQNEGVTARISIR